MSKLTVEELITYLADAEGSSIHKNKTEADITAFYGVYRIYNKDFEGWFWLDELAEEYELDDYRTNRVSRKAMNNLIKDDEVLWNAYQAISKLYHERNMQKMHLDIFASSKTALTFFSLVTNAGKKRATKVLQKALNELNVRTGVDGDFGPETKRNLQKITNEKELNDAMLRHMQLFYDYLIRTNPSKYAIYKNGWTNRLRALA